MDYQRVMRTTEVGEKLRQRARGGKRRINKSFEEENLKLLFLVIPNAMKKSFFWRAGNFHTKRSEINWMKKKQNENMMNLQSTDTEDADKHCTSRVHNSMRQHALWPFAASVKYKSHSKQEDTRWNDFVALSTLRDRVTAWPARNVSWHLLYQSDTTTTSVLGVERNGKEI